MTEYDTGVIFELLTAAFEPADLWRLCRDTEILRPICKKVNRTDSIEAN